MSEYIINTNERLQRLEELGEIWLDIYNNRRKISEPQWKEYKRTIHDYLKHELEIIWLDFYRNRGNLDQHEWQEYEKLIHQYLRLIACKIL